jgi:hypothetical protein
VLTLSTTILSGVNASTAPILSVTGAFDLPAPDSLFAVPAGGGATLAGALLDATNAALMLGANALLVDSAFTSLTTAPLFQFSASTADIGASLVAIGPQGAFSAAGPLVNVTGSILTTGSGPLVRVEAGGSLDIAIADASPLLNLQGGLLASAASLLDLSNSTVRLAGPVVKLGRQSILANTAGPVLRISGGTLSADSLLTTDGTGNQLFLTGSLMDLFKTAVTLRKVFDAPSGGADSVLRALTAGEPFMRLLDSSVTLTGLGAELIRFGAETAMPQAQTGVGLIASGGTVNLNGPLFTLGGVSLLDTTPQLQLTQTTIGQGGSSSLIEVKSLPVAMIGSLLEARGSTLSGSSSLLRIGGTSLTQAGDASPFIRLDASTVSIADFFAEVSGSMALAAPLARLTSSLLTTGADFVSAP